MGLNGVVFELNEEKLVELGGWMALKDARGMVEKGGVVECELEGRCLSGVVEWEGQRYEPRLNLRSQTFVENRCSCLKGRRGQVCVHALALCLSRMQPRVGEGNSSEELVSADEETEDLGVGVKSLQLGKERGVKAAFRITLPPNLSAAASRDKIMVKLELEMEDGVAVLADRVDRGKAYLLSENDQRLAMLVESWCGGSLHGLLQLSRVQLSDLLQTVSELPRVFMANQPGQALLWKGGKLSQVHAFLDGAVEEKKTEEKSRKTAGTDAVVKRRTGGGDASGLGEGTAGLNEASLQVDGSPHYLSICLPSRELQSHEHWFQVLREAGFVLEPRNRRWWLRDGHKVLNFLAEHYEALLEESGVVFSDNFRQRFEGLSVAGFQARAVEQGEGFELEVECDAAAAVSAQALQSQISKGRNYCETEKGGIVLVSPKRLERLNQVFTRLSGDRKHAWNTSMKGRFASNELCDLEEALSEGQIGFEAPESWISRSAALRNLSKLSEAPVPDGLKKRLRLYQLIGVSWMHHLYRNGFGGILADEMGLGKTIQAIALHRALEADLSGPTLVVCPAGLVENWRREFESFAPECRVYVHHGSGRATALPSSGVIVTSYAILTRDEGLFRAQAFGLIFGDEAQHLKNRKTLHTRTLKRLRSSGRFLLTGTPVENALEDLVSLFEFLMPGYLSTPQLRQMRSSDRLWHQQRIQERAAPYLLRRTKLQVAPELPEKIEQVLYCSMQQSQQTLYETVRRRASHELDRLQAQGVGEQRMRIAALNELLRLRQICADPRLLDAGMEAEDSGKLLVFRELLDECLDGGNRMLVFSQFVSLLQMLRAELDESGISYCYLDGSTRNRMAEVDRFQADTGIPVFLISLKAGGTGLNLTGADTVVHFDPWWNPAVEAQATDRAHRIGQSRSVRSIRMIVAGSVEEKVQLMQQEKRRLLQTLFEESERVNASIGLEDMRELLAG